MFLKVVLLLTILGFPSVGLVPVSFPIWPAHTTLLCNHRMTVPDSKECYNTPSKGLLVTETHRTHTHRLSQRPRSHVNYKMTVTYIVYIMWLK